ncbi:MAG: hypothetical protein Q4P15_08580 [Propionibacteriaceae bacterium]|nr:hypothetical protein [Propionibacteriaceae bacterium]
MRRRLRTTVGSITHLAMAEGLPIRFAQPARSVALLGDSMAFVIFDGDDGDKNLAVLGPAGEELARLGTTTGTGTIDEVLDVGGEIRVIEATSLGLFQASLDLDSLTLVRVAEWQ